MLEQRLEVPVGSFFARTQRDRDQLDRAHRLTAALETGIAELEPPSIRIEKVPREVSQDSVRLQIEAAGVGITEESVEARVLGAGRARSAEFRHRAESDGKWREIETTVTVPLLKGRNDIEALVADGRELTARQTVSVEYETKTDRPRTLWLGLVGVEDYSQTDDVGDLDYPVSDIERVRDLFDARQGGFYRTVEVRAWCSGETFCDAPAKSTTLRGEVPKFFDRMKPGDHALLYVSGHGVRLDSGYHFVPTDGRIAAVETLVGWREWTDWLASSDSVGKRMLVMDSCHSGAVGRTRSVLQRNAAQALRYNGLYIMASSAADASSFEVDAIDGGLFTHTFTRGLQGEADNLPADGRVRFTELFEYVNHRLPRLANRYDLQPQRPFGPRPEHLRREARDFTVFELPDARLPVDLTVFNYDSTGMASEAPSDVHEEWSRHLTETIDGLQVVSNRNEARFAVRIHRLNAQRIRVQVVRHLPDGSSEILETFEPATDANDPTAIAREIETILPSADSKD